MAFYWNEEKNNQLKEERAISFERIVVAIEEDHLIDAIENPNKTKYKNQLILIVDIDGYAVCVPCVLQENGDYFLKTLFPSRKYTKKIILEEKMNELIEEKELIDSIENDDWQSVQNFGQLKKDLKDAARKTLIKDYRINIRISKRDVEALKTKALEEGIPYQTLVGYSAESCHYDETCQALCGSGSFLSTRL